MKKLLQKRNNNKGFTLVELIVVLVILAILLAILGPSLVGYIKQANEKQVQLEARDVYIAAMSVAAETAATDPSFSTTSFAAIEDDVEALLGSEKYTANVEEIVITDCQLTKLVYAKGNFTATFTTDGGWEITTSGT